MSLEYRFIPIIQIDKRRLVKTLKFVPKRYLGDPLNAIRIFNLKCANELIVMDINATQTRNIDWDFLKKISAQAFLPITYGGGISSIDDVHKLYEIGFDRILLGTSAVENPSLITQISNIYGRQSVICSVDVRQGLWGLKWSVSGNSKNLGSLHLKKVIDNFVDLGVGEILLHDVNRDGTYLGLNHKLIREVSELSPVPIIICGGTKSIEDAYHAIQLGASAIAAGSLFSFYGRHKAVLINYSVST